MFVKLTQMKPIFKYNSVAYFNDVYYITNRFNIKKKL